MAEDETTTCAGLIEHIAQKRLRQVMHSRCTEPPHIDNRHVNMENLEHTLTFLLELTKAQHDAIMKLDRRVQQLEWEGAHDG